MYSTLLCLSLRLVIDGLKLADGRIDENSKIYKRWDNQINSL